MPRATKKPAKPSRVAPAAHNASPRTDLRDRIVGLEHVDIASIRGMDGNPKSPTDDDAGMLDDSLANHGYVMPVAVRRLRDGTHELIDGHHRVERIRARYPDVTSIHALILDVHSVADGRRILLALQHTVGFDTMKLDAFVSGMLKDGARAADLMLDTGYTGKELDAFARAGQDFVDGLGAGGDGETNENVSRAGLLPEHVQFAVALTREQSALVSKAMSVAKKLSDAKVKADALVAICQCYLDQHRT